MSKFIELEMECNACECKYKRVVRYPSWYDYIIFFLLMDKWYSAILWYQLNGLCPKCEEYNKIKSSMKKVDELNRYIKERDNFLRIKRRINQNERFG